MIQLNSGIHSVVIGEGMGSIDERKKKIIILTRDKKVYKVSQVNNISSMINEYFIFHLHFY